MPWVGFTAKKFRDLIVVVGRNGVEICETIGAKVSSSQTFKPSEQGQQAYFFTWFVRIPALSLSNTSDHTLLSGSGDNFCPVFTFLHTSKLIVFVAFSARQVCRFRSKNHPQLRNFARVFFLLPWYGLNKLAHYQIRWSFESENWLDFCYNCRKS